MRTILAVDDEYDMLEALRALLADEGYRVVTAANGEEALARLAEEAPEVVLVDLMMPGLGGRGLLKALREDPAWSAIPVVVMTAAPQALAPGERAVAALLPKPFALPDLLRVLEAILGHRTT